MRRVTDLIAKEMQLVVRYQGGHNAGHTLVVDGVTFALQLVPSGVLYDHITPVIGNGVVVDPIVLLAEMDALTAKGVDCSRLAVSRRRASPRSFAVASSTPARRRRCATSASRSHPAESPAAVRHPPDTH